MNHRIVLTIMAALILATIGQCALAKTEAAPQHKAAVLVLYAFDAEGQRLSDMMLVDSTVRQMGRKARFGKLGGREIILIESGIGMTNAAMITQIMIDRYSPRQIIFTGIAGAIDSAVRVGDIVVCERWAQHDFGYIGKNDLEPEGIETYAPTHDSIESMRFFTVDSSLLNVARGINPDSVGWTGIEERRPRLLIGGVGVTGNTFIDNVEKRIWLSQTFGALITDMESAAVAQVCTANDKPFIILRSASDLAGGSGSATAAGEIKQFFKVAADNSARVVVELLKNMK